MRCDAAAAVLPAGRQPVAAGTACCACRTKQASAHVARHQWSLWAATAHVPGPHTTHRGDSFVPLVRKSWHCTKNTHQGSYMPQRADMVVACTFWLHCRAQKCAQQMRAVVAQHVTASYTSLSSCILNAVNVACVGWSSCLLSSMSMDSRLGDGTTHTKSAYTHDGRPPPVVGWWLVAELSHS